MDDVLVFAQEGGKVEKGKEEGVNAPQKGMDESWKKQEIAPDGYHYKNKRYYHCDDLSDIARDYPNMDIANMGDIDVHFGFCVL